MKQKGKNMTELKEPLVKKADMTDEEWKKLESLCEKYQELNPDWERTGFETIEDMENLIAEIERENADKVFEDADRANAKKRAELLRAIALDYIAASKEMFVWKYRMKAIVKHAEEDGFSKAQIDAVIYAMNVQEGFERMVFEEASEPYNPEKPETKPDNSENPNNEESTEEGTEDTDHENDTAE